jgi:hypothetical protein
VTILKRETEQQIEKGTPTTNPTLPEQLNTMSPALAKQWAQWLNPTPQPPENQQAPTTSHQPTPTAGHQQDFPSNDQPAPYLTNHQPLRLGHSTDGPGHHTHPSTTAQSQPNHSTPYQILEALINGAIQANSSASQLPPTVTSPSANKLGDRIWHIHGWAGCRANEDLPTFWNNFSTMKTKISFDGSIMGK